MILDLKNIIPLEPVDPDEFPITCTDRVERKLYLGREADGMIVEGPIEIVMEQPQIHVFVPRRSYRNN